MKKTLLVLSILIIVTTIVADVPREISFQGKLVGVSSPVNLTFKIFDDAAAGSELWSENHLGTILDGDGLFNVILGQTTTLDLDFIDEYWIEVQVDGTPLPSRYKLTSDAYAFRAICADTVDWFGIKSMPAGFADGIDNEGGGVHDHWGESWSGSGTGLRLTSSDGIGLYAITSASTPGVKAAVNGKSDAASGAVPAVLGYTQNHNAPGISGQWGSTISMPTYPVGVYGNSDGGHGVHGRTGHSGSAGIYGSVTGAGTYAGYFDGDVHITDTLTVDGKVGIGTTNPAYLLHTFTDCCEDIIVEDDEGSRAVIDARGADIYMGAHSNHPLRLVTNNDPKMTIQTDGKVGIGTTNPSDNLVIGGTGTTRMKIGYDGSYNHAESGRLAFDEDISASGVCGFEFHHDGSEDKLHLVGGCFTPDTIITFMRDGDIGIGVTYPTHELEVDGDVHITGEFTSETPSFTQVSSYAMRPRDESMEYSISSISGDIYNTGASTIYLYGAVNIPHGATIQEITLYWYDDCASSVGAWLYRKDHTGTSTNMATVSSSGTGGYGSITDGTIVEPVIDLENYRYYIYCTIPGSEGTDLRYGSVVIEYVK